MKRIIYSLIVVLIISLTIGCGSKKEEIKKVEKKKKLIIKAFIWKYWRVRETLLMKMIKR